MSYIEDESEDEQNMTRCLYERDYDYEVEEGEIGDRDVDGSEDEEVEVEGESDKGRVFTIDRIPNRMKKGELEKLRFQYQIPNSIKMRLPKKEEKPSQPPNGEVLIHPDYFRFGFRLPLHPYLQKFVCASGLALMQLNPEVIRVAIAMFILWRENGLGEPSFQQFRNQVDLKILPRSIGWWYQSPYPSNGALISGKAYNGSWKKKFFFASGDWEFGRVVPSSQERVKTHFQSRARFTRPESPPFISEKELEDIAFVRANVKVIDRSKETLLSSENLEKYNFIRLKTKGMDGGKKKMSMPPRKDNEIWLRMLEKRGAGPSNAQNNLNNIVPLQISSPLEVVLIDESFNENQRSDLILGASSPKRLRVHDVSLLPSDRASINVHPRLFNFIQATSRAIQEPERSRLEIGSQRKMVENSFISSAEALLRQHETHQGLLNDLDNKKLIIVDLQRKLAEERETFEVEKKKFQDVLTEAQDALTEAQNALTQAQDELQVKEKEAEGLKSQVVELSSTVSDYTHHVENAETKGFNRCLKFVEKVYKDSLNLSLMYDAIKNGEVGELSDDDEEAHMEVDESNTLNGTQALNSGPNI